MSKHQVEALLFSSGKSMTTDQIVELSKLDKAKVKRALKSLQKNYAERDSAIEIINDDESWKMAVRNEHLPLVSNIVADTELSKACMETLAVIAFQYPNILQSEVVERRGSNAYEHIKELEKLQFIRKTPEGRSYKISLTDKFFNYFEVSGEKDIKDVFKNVKVPEKVGDMDVVEISEEKAKEKGEPLEGMEVVKVSETPTLPETVREQRERELKEQEEKGVPEMAKVQTTKEEKEQHLQFLDDLDQKIAKLTERNNTNDEDPLLRRSSIEESSDEEPEDEEESN